MSLGRVSQYKFYEYLLYTFYAILPTELLAQKKNLSDLVWYISSCGSIDWLSGWGSGDPYMAIGLLVFMVAEYEVWLAANLKFA